MMRRERDSLGELDIPPDVYWGVQTLRAIRNFPISGTPIAAIPALIHAMARIKQACARVNTRIGALAPDIAAAIEAACLDVVAGRLDHAFPIDVFQGGAGTSTNMNMNEVLANRALEHLGRPRGDYATVHPNDHVNCGQSTNDVYPTAIRLALITETGRLRQGLAELASAFERKGESFSHIRKLGRTQLQDAVPMTLGQEFRAYATTVREDVARLAEASRLLHEINLGGTAIGTGVNAPSAYAEAVIPELAQLTGLPLVRADNLVEACWDTGALVLFSGMLKRSAVKLSKIASDLRLLSSGPRGGIGEIRLPALQPGSSIMPGKVNPVAPEVINQIAYAVIGADATVTMAAEAGQLQLNAMEPVMAFSLLHSLKIMINGVAAFRTTCVEGIEADESRCAATLRRSTAFVTELAPQIGYEAASKLAKTLLASEDEATARIEAAFADDPERLSIIRSAFG